MAALRLFALLCWQCAARAAAERAAWFVSWQQAGHIRALCPTARELRRRGWSVSVLVHEEVQRYVPEDLQKDVTSLGALPWPWEEELELRSLLWDPSSTDNASASKEEVNQASVRRADASERYFLGSQRSVAQGLQAALAAHSAGDGAAPLLVVDVSSVGAMDVAELHGLPFVVFSSWPVGPTLQSIADPARFQHAWIPSELFAFTQTASQQSLKDRAVRFSMTSAAPFMLEGAGFHVPRRTLRKELGLDSNGPAGGRIELLEPARMPGGVPPLVLVTSHWALDRPRPLPPHIHLVGPTEDYAALAQQSTLSKDLQDWLKSADSVVFISLGTTVLPKPRQIQALLEGMRQMSSEQWFLWDVREEMREALVDLPENVRAEEWPSQLAVLASGKVSAFVSHCGHNSLHEAMHFGVPIIGMPYIADQLVSARVVVEVGVGVRLLTHRVTASDFAAAVREVTRNDSFREAAHRVGRLASIAGGSPAAADLISLVAEHGTGHWQMHSAGAAGRLWDVWLLMCIPAFGFVAAIKYWRREVPKAKEE